MKEKPTPEEKPARPLRELLQALSSADRPPDWLLAAARQKHGWGDDTLLTSAELKRGLERAAKEEVR